jgi:peptidoglycan hydrolase CwlO-like protein
MKLRHFFVLCCSTAFAFNAQADIYKRVDDEGHVTYSSKPIKGGKKVHLDPLPTMPAPPKASPENFPRVNSDTQGQRDDTRRKILEDELATEQKSLDDAQARLKEGQENPEVFKSPSGQTFRNVSKYEEKVAKLQEEVTAHEKNIEALKSELGNLK